MTIGLRILESFVKNHDVKKVATVEGSKGGKGAWKIWGFQMRLCELSWNVRGINDILKRSLVKNIVLSSFSMVVCL